MAERSMTSTLGSALALGTAMGVVTFSGHAMFEAADEKTKADRLAGKEEAKNRFRRPINEVINELGEGRGMCTPVVRVVGV
jgi:hypothetical protein